MEDQSDQTLYRIIRTVVRAFLSTYPNQRIGELDDQDLAHAIFVRFVEKDRAQMAKYEPERGAFAGWVAMKTRFWLRTIARKYRDREQLAHFEHLGDAELVDMGQRDLEDTIDMRLRLLAVADCVASRVQDPIEVRGVDLLFRQLCTDDRLMSELGMDRDQMYRIKAKLRGLARECLANLYPEDRHE